MAAANPSVALSVSSHSVSPKLDSREKITGTYTITNNDTALDPSRQFAIAFVLDKDTPGFPSEQDKARRFPTEPAEVLPGIFPVGVVLATITSGGGTATGTFEFSWTHYTIPYRYRILAQVHSMDATLSEATPAPFVLDILDGERNTCQPYPDGVGY